MSVFPTPTYTPGSRGNAINSVAVNAGKSAAAIINLTGVLGGALTCEIAVGTNTVTNATTFSVYQAPGQYNTSSNAAAPITTVNANAAAGNTSLVVANAGWISKTQMIAVCGSGNTSGEIVSVTSVSSNTLTVGALANAYNTGDLVFFIEQTASGGVCNPSLGNGNWAANSNYSTTLYPPYGFLYIVGAKNNDATNPTTVTVTTGTTS